MGDIFTGKDNLYGIGEEATYGTALADSVALMQLSCANFTINPGLNFRSRDQAIGQRHPDISCLAVDSYGSITNCTIPTEVRKNELAYWLYLLLQKATEGDTTPFPKTFTLPATSVIPDFSASEGLFMTLIKKMPVASVSEKVTSMIGRKVELSVSADANDGNLFANIDLVSAKTFSMTANPSGTWTIAARSIFNFHNIQTFTVGGNTCILKEWKLTIDNNGIPVGPDGSGGWSNFAVAGWNVTNEITIVWDANARTARTNAASGAEQDIILEWGSAGVDGHLKFEVKGVFEPPSDLVDGETEDVSLKLHGASDSANSEQLITVTLSDAQDLSWPGA